MTVKKVWMSVDTAGKNRYALRILGSVLGIAVLMLAITGGAAVLALNFAGDNIKLLSLILCFGATALAVLLAMKLGRRSAHDATVFFLTVDDRLYAVDARTMVSYGRGIPGYISGAIETQKFLEELAPKLRVPPGADEIIKVESLRESRHHYTIRCRVRRSGQQSILHYYFLVKGYEDEEQLIRELERRKNWRSSLETADSRYPIYILLSTGAFILLSVLCLLSHPAFGLLPQNIYFPCLGADFIAIACMVCFFIAYRRGE